jgi:Ni,Fe-hydrogenase I cytochrome b subunit
MSGILICLHCLLEAGMPKLQLRHWLTRANVAVLVACGLALAGATPWQAAIVGISAGLICIISGTWRVIAPASGLVAVLGLSTWMMGFHLIG